MSQGKPHRKAVLSREWMKQMNNPYDYLAEDYCRHIEEQLQRLLRVKMYLTCLNKDKKISVAGNEKMWSEKEIGRDHEDLRTTVKGLDFKFDVKPWMWNGWKSKTKEIQ